MSEISRWFSGRSAFVTGATGFVGKCLVEKLLRDCCDIETIYIMMRAKKGKTTEQRKTDYMGHVVFGCIRDQQPHQLDKIVVVDGDLMATNLAMSDTIRKRVAERVSVIFHCAADVRFDRPLTDAFRSNVLGTKSLLDFAKEFHQLDAFVFVSTAFSQTVDVVLEEKHYPSPIRPEIMRSIIENTDPDMLDALVPKLLGKFPNTYSFTKSLSEQLVYDYRNEFPTAIARPPIIIGTWREPLKGYTEGIHGINGWCLASGRGVLRSLLCTGENPCHAMPADVAVNGVILLAYECYQQHQNRKCEQIEQFEPDSENRSNNEPIYFNIIEEKSISWGTYLDTLIPTYLKYPYNFALWLPGGSFKKSRIYHNLCVLLFQLIPAIILDMLLLLFRQKPFLVKVQRMIVTMSEALHYYLNEKFHFKSTVYSAFHGKLNTIDRDIFYDKAKFEVVEYLENGSAGSRKYLAKENDEDLPRARAYFKRLWYMDIVAKIVVGYYITIKFLDYFELSLF